MSTKASPPDDVVPPRDPRDPRGRPVTDKATNPNEADANRQASPVLDPRWRLEAAPNPEDIAARDRAILANNDVRERQRLAQANRDRGVPEPRVGSKLFVTCVRGIARRSRGGLRFDVQAKREVEVVDLPEPELAKRQRDGASVVSVYGAEQILADDALLVHSTGGVTQEAAHERVVELEAENARLHAELAAARRDAPPDPGDGSSSRLKAAARVREAGGDFGQPPPLPPASGK